MLLPGPGNITHNSSTQWQHLNGSSSRTVLQFYKGSRHPTIHVPYVGRAVFHPSSGSLLLENVQESDSGIYKVTVEDGESQKILLEVLSEWWAWAEERGDGWEQSRALQLLDCRWAISLTKGLGEGI